MDAASAPAPAAPAAAAPSTPAGRRRARAEAPPPGDTGTHWTGPSEYLLAAARRASIFSVRRHPLEANGESLAVALQRFVHHEGARPPVRQILLHLRLLALYPPVPDLLPDLVLLLEFENPHVCRLAHYHVRAAAPVRDAGLYREVVEALEREAARPSPARRAAATKTLAKVFAPADVDRAVDFVSDVFNRIGGARVRDPATVQQRRKVAGIAVPGTDVADKQVDDAKRAPARRAKGDDAGLAAKLRKRPSLLGGGSALRPGAEAAPDVEDPLTAAAAAAAGPASSAGGGAVDDGAGGVMAPSGRAAAVFVRSRFGKMLVGHAVFAALRRINRVAADACRVEAFFFDSGLMSAVPSTVRHCVALLEIRASRSPVQVSKYVAPRLPHRNPPDHKRLTLEDLGAKVYFARILGALAEDPNLASHLPSPPPSRRQGGGKPSSSAPATSAGAAAARAQAVAGGNVKERAGNLFKFLFNRDRVAEISSSVRAASSAMIAAAVAPAGPRRVEDPRGVDFAEALVNLLKNASNRVLLEALRGLSHRRWTTWFEAPIPQTALYNSPELADPNALDSSAGGGWGIGDGDDDDDDDDDDGRDAAAGRDGDGVDEAAYEDDIADGADAEAAAGAGAGAGGAATSAPSSASAAARLRTRNDGEDPDLVDPEAAEKSTFLSRASARRKEKRESRALSSTPFYLRRVGAGMVPALEVILRRVFHAMLHDEAIRRFAAADAVIVLARAKMYGHTAADHEQLHRARAAASQAQNVFISRAVPSSSRAVVVAGGAPSGNGSDGDSGDHPFEPLVATLKDIMDDDPNQYVRGRAGIALAFVLAAGAGRMRASDDGSRDWDDEVELPSSAVLVRYFRSFVTREGAGRGVGLRLVSEVIDYLVHELLDLAPELAPSAVALAELWAVTHPTIGVCGRLGALWEKVLSMGEGAVVGASIFRAMAVKPHAERVAAAAAAFLRRRTLDLAVLTVGASQMAGNGVPEPLPRAISMEMEKYLSLLWHSALLGPSAECRTLSIEAMGGAAALAGDPLRVCTYERLVELVRVRGLGLKIPAENAMDALDVLYFCRERFSEARHQNRVARDGSSRSPAWLQVVWRLAAESSSAAQILLGIAPPTGWMPLGPGAAADVANAEEMYGDVRDRQATEKLRDASVARRAAPSETPLLALDESATRSELSSGSKVGPPSGGVFAYAPKDFDRLSAPSPSGWHSDGDEGRYGERSRSPSPPSRDFQRPRRGTSNGRYGDDATISSDTTRESSGSRRHGRGAVDEADADDLQVAEDRKGGVAAGHRASNGRDHLIRDSLRESGEHAARRMQRGSATRKEQEAEDLELAKRLQKEERGGRGLFGDDKRLGAAAAAAAYAPGAAAKFLKSSLKAGGETASKASKLAKSLGGRGGPPS